LWLPYKPSCRVGAILYGCPHRKAVRYGIEVSPGAIHIQPLWGCGDLSGGYTIKVNNTSDPNME